MTVPFRLRVTLAFACGMALAIVAIGAFVYVRVGAALLEAVDAGLRSRAEVLAAQVREEGPDVPGVPATLIESDEAFAQVADGSGRILHSSRIVEDVPLLDAKAVSSLTQPKLFDRQIRGIDDVTRILALPVQHERRGYVLMVGSSLQDRRDVMVQLAATLAVGAPVLLALVSFAGWLLVGAALRPVDRIRQEAAAVSALEPDRRLPVPPGDDELARLTRTLNAMLSRLQEALERERRFVDDASHELRTPLSVLRGRLEIALSKSRSQEELESALRGSLVDAEHLSRVAEDLLVLSRAADGRLPILREQVRLSELLEQSVGPHRTRAEAAGVRLEIDVENGSANMDPVRVRQVIENLLDNSIRHVREGGLVRVSANHSDGEVRIRVEDSGDGFPPDLLPTALEPFTRGDKDRPQPGAGLGLAIVRAVAEAHGGGVSCTNRPEGGARVTVTLKA